MMVGMKVVGILSRPASETHHTIHRDAYTATPQYAHATANTTQAAREPTFTSSVTMGQAARETPSITQDKVAEKVTDRVEHAMHAR